MTLRIAIVGRTEMLLDAAKALAAHGYVIPIVMTRREEDYYQATQEDYRAFAAEIGAEFIPDAKVNSPEAKAALEAAACDVAFSVNWPSLVTEAVLNIPKCGFFNVHPGDLPRYRGNACFNWAILNGERQVGICVHQMVPELDAGPVISRRHIQIDETTTVTALFEHWRRLTPEMIVEAAGKLDRYPACLEAQSTDVNTHLRGYPRRPDDNKLDWNWPVEKIDRLIRASGAPFPGAFTTLEGDRKLTIWSASIVQHPGPFLAMPGQVLSRAEDTVFVAASDGVLALHDIRLDGCETHAESATSVAKSLRNRLV